MDFQLFTNKPLSHPMCGVCSCTDIAKMVFITTFIAQRFKKPPSIKVTIVEEGSGTDDESSGDGTLAPIAAPTIPSDVSSSASSTGTTSPAPSIRMLSPLRRTATHISQSSSSALSRLTSRSSSSDTSMTTVEREEKKQAKERRKAARKLAKQIEEFHDAIGAAIFVGQLRYYTAEDVARGTGYAGGSHVIEIRPKDPKLYRGKSDDDKHLAVLARFYNDYQHNLPLECYLRAFTRRTLAGGTWISFIVRTCPDKGKYVALPCNVLHI